MSIGSKITKRLVSGIATVCVVVGMVSSAFAVPPNEILRIETNQTFTNACCVFWPETVTVTEPKAVVPITVTLSTDYRSDLDAVIGISVNNHPCMTEQLVIHFAPSDGAFHSENLEWVVLPSDGLIKGNNTITLCGGVGFNGGNLTLGFNTLAARISK